MDLLPTLLSLVGVGLVCVGAGHVLLPRALGWTDAPPVATHPLSGLVIKMHVASVGAFLAGFGILTILAAGDLDSSSPIIVALLTCGVIIFLLRWLAEIFLVSRALRCDSTTGHGWRVLHGGGLIIWLVLAVAYALGLIHVLAPSTG